MSNRLGDRRRQRGTNPALKALCAVDIICRIHSELSIADILSIRLTCWPLNLAINAWWPVAFNINVRLSRFFSTLENILAFRSLQAETGALISGSQALQFFDRSFYPESDLDIYISPFHALKLAHFLNGVGYQLRPTTSQLDRVPTGEYGEIIEATLAAEEPLPDGYSWQGLNAVFTFIKANPSGTPPLKVEIVVSDTAHCPLASILMFHSTLVMNFISHNAAYALFPFATFIRRAGMTLGSNSHNSEAAMLTYQKYTGRGFRLSAVPVPPLSQETPIRYGQRLIGDSQTWIIPLDTTGIDNPPWFRDEGWLDKPHHYVGQGFHLETIKQWPQIKNMVQNPPESFNLLSKIPQISFNVFSSPLLRQAIVTPPLGYISDIGDFMKKQTKFQLSQAAIQCDRDIALPGLNPHEITGWNFWDIYLKRQLDDIFETNLRLALRV